MSHPALFRLLFCFIFHFSSLGGFHSNTMSAWPVSTSTLSQHKSSTFETEYFE